MNKRFKSLSFFVIPIILITLISTPQVASASWWNPFTWFKKEIKVEQVVTPPQQVRISKQENTVPKKEDSKPNLTIVKPKEKPPAEKSILTPTEVPPVVIPPPAVIPSKENYKLEDVIKEWRPNTVRVTCITLDTEGNKKSYSDGSGLLTMDSSKNIFVLTNKHVFFVKGALSDYCDIYFPVNGEIYKVEKTERATSADGKDLARLKILRPTEYIREVIRDSSKKRDCKNTTPNSTDDLVILGYPQGKPKSDISYATGKIVGYLDNYFISSATITNGYSGGVAVSLKDNCLLGTPSASKKDDLTKSLILDINRF